MKSSVLLIKSEYPESSIREERKRRSIKTMDSMTLMRLFSGMITFIEEPSSKTLLYFDDFPIMGFAVNFAEMFNYFLLGRKEYSFDDFDGGDSVTLTQMTESTIKIEGPSRGDVLEVESSMLKKAYSRWISHMLPETIKLFPELNDNPEFRKLSNFISSV